MQRKDRASTPRQLRNKLWGLILQSS